MYVDSIKIGNTNARAIRTVVDLETVPTQVFENSPMLIKVGETLYVKNKVVGNIIGTWHLKDTISYATNVGVNFDFVSNDTTYTALLWQNSELHYASQATSDVVVYNSSGWVNQAYRTIVIKSGENADLLAFLQASAEKLIDGYYYYTEVGGSGGVVIEKYTQDMENFADIVFTADEFNTILNSDSVVVKLNIANIQNIFFAKAMQVADGSNQDIVYLNSYVASAGTNFVLGLVKPHDSTQVAHIVLKQTLPEPPTAINLNDSFPSTATNGTLSSEQLRTLQASDQNYIIFNNELFRLNDKQSSEGYLVYSHNGHDTTGCFFQKCITITISTCGWVLETQENQAKLVSGTNIKTINNQSILGSGNITIEGGSGGGGTSDTAYVSNSTLYIEEGTTAGGGTVGGSDLYYENIKYETIVPDNGTPTFLGAYSEKPTKKLLLEFNVSTSIVISKNAGIFIDGYVDREEDGVSMTLCIVHPESDDVISYAQGSETNVSRKVSYMYACYWLSSSAAEAFGFTTGGGFYVSVSYKIYNYKTS